MARLEMLGAASLLPICEIACEIGCMVCGMVVQCCREFDAAA
jgi:hypothetical protein